MSTYSLTLVQQLPVQFSSLDLSNQVSTNILNFSQTQEEILEEEIDASLFLNFSIFFFWKIHSYENKFLNLT